MKTIHLCLLTLAACLAMPMLAGAAVTVQQADDRSVSITTPMYTAHIDGSGNLLDLVVQGAKAFAHRFGTPGEKLDGTPSVNVNNQLVAVRLGDKRVEWTFYEESIHVVTQGYSFECQLDPSVKTVVVPGGQGGPATDMHANSTAFVLANDLTVSYAMPFHAGANRLVPTCYCNGTAKPGDLLEFDLKLGAPVDALQLLSVMSVSGIGDNYGNLLDGGNQGYGIVHFPDPAAIAFKTTQVSQAKVPMALEYQLSILDHRVAGKEVAAQRQQATLDAGGKATLTWTVPALAPGFYYLTVSAWKDGKRLTDTKLTFAVDLAHYSHPLTRPADFTAFWQRQNQKLKDTPANTALTLLSAPENPNKAYEVQLDMPDGSKIHGCLIIPAKIGTAPAQFGSLMTGPLNELIAGTKKPDFNPGKQSPVQDYVSFTIALPQEGTYTYWKDAEENNIQQCIFAWLRGIDYLASRPEVNPQRIMACGASRTGGLTIIVGALRPHNVCAANGFVDTSCGLSWEDKPYLGWGKSPDATDPAAMHAFCLQAAYVDPVNFAPDCKCPTILAYGIDDDLAPPQGMEAAYHLLGAPWKRISRDIGGHQHSNGCIKIQQDLFTYLAAAGASGLDQSHTLTEH